MPRGNWSSLNSQILSPDIIFSNILFLLMKKTKLLMNVRGSGFPSFGGGDFFQPVTDLSLFNFRLAN